MDYCGEVIMLYIIFLISVLTIQDTQGVPFSVSSGLYWKKLDGVIAYKASLSLVYKSKLPIVKDAYLGIHEGKGFCVGQVNDVKCILYHWLLQVDKEVGNWIKWINTSLGVDAEGDTAGGVSHRVSWSVNFVGRFAHYCYGLITEHQIKPLVTNQDVMSQYEQRLNEQMTEAFSEIDNVNLNMKNYSEQVEPMFRRVIDVGVNMTKIIQRFQSFTIAAGQQSSNQSISLFQLSAH